MNVIKTQGIFLIAFKVIKLPGPKNESA